MNFKLVKNFALFAFFISSNYLFGQLSGTYTIGGTSPNYSTISAAVTAMDFSGVSGPVTFNVRAGVYNEQITLNQVLGGSSTKTVTFQSDPSNSTNPIIKYAGTSAKNYVWEFNGADYVTLKGIDFQSLDPNYGRVIHYKGACNFNNLIDCQIEGNGSEVTGVNTATIYHESGSTNMSHGNIIDNCTILGGSYGVYLKGNAATSREDSNRVINCSIKNFYSVGIWAEFQTKFEARNNIIEAPKTSHTSATSIYMQYCYSSEVNSNKILHKTSGGRGVSLNYCYSNTKVYNNMISMIGTSSATGINSVNCSYNQYLFQ